MTAPIHMTAARFRQIRAAAGLTQAELAVRLRIESDRAIRRWEAGERPVSGPVSLLMEQLAQSAAGPVSGR